MTSLAAIDYLRSLARNGSDRSKYPDLAVQNAINGVCNDFLFTRNCRVTRTSADLPLAAGTWTLPTLPADFKPDRLVRAYLINLPVNSPHLNPTLDVVSYATILDKQANHTQSAQPTMIGFETATTGGVWGTPDQAYTTRILYDVAYNPAVPNIPDEYLEQILRWGGVYWLQGNEPENARAMQTCWTNYMDFCKSVKSNGIGTMGAQVERRVPLRGIPGNGNRRTIYDRLYSN